MNPEVSIIIAAYNTEAYIAQAIESALGQTEQNIEVIVVDNASTDATGQIAKNFIDNRLKVIVTPKNLGPGGARNLATRAARGKWVAPLDSDDWYAPERLEKLLQVADAEDADMIADDLYFIRDGEKLPWSTLLSESGEHIEKIRVIDSVYFVETDQYGQRGLHLGLSKPMIKREFLVNHGIEYNEKILGVDQDFWFDVRCLAHKARFVLVPKPYYFLRSRSGSQMTRSKVEHLNKSCQAALDYIQKEVVKQNPDLVSALSKNLVVFEQHRAYYRVVEPLKRGAFLDALIAMIHNPYFFVHFLMQLPSILSRRVQYYFFGNKLVYEIMYQRDKK